LSGRHPAWDPSNEGVTATGPVLLPSAAVRFFKVIALVAVVAGVVAVSATAFAVVADPLPIGVVGTPYQHLPEIHGGGAPYAFYLEGGRLPQGMKIRQDDACICGTPEESGTFVFNILGYTGIDGPQPWDHTDSPDFTLNVRPKVTIDTTSLKSAAVGAPYTATLVATGAGAYALEWSLTAGSLPTGLTLSPDGTISGTPTTVGTSFFTVRVKDQDGGPRSVTQQLTLSVVAPLSPSAPTPPAAEVGRPFKITLAATGGAAPLSWSISGGAAPAGLTLDAATGVLSGVPTTAGTFPLTAKVTDAGGNSATVDLTVKVARALEIITARLRNATVGRPYLFVIKSRGGVPETTWRLIGSRLPAHVQFDASRHALVGTPQKAGAFRVKVRAKDSLGGLSTKTLVLNVLSKR
jgi:hypothetical protein